MRWEFKQEPGEPHRWRWQCIDEMLGSTLKVSPVPFRTCPNASRMQRSTATSLRA